ncbi:MAG TPA: alcohol dehydrogenase catalytic domain-containing protein [Mycobacteriales bacterium]|nr:alcohol dehydrogenase catalytic domain-containing protein [Mycobacteriales bacterium]
MRAAVFEGPGNIRIQQVPDPEVELPTDAVVRVVSAAICGSDLWSYRGYGQRAPGSRIGHEFVGVVADVGPDVRTVRTGDLVVSPFTWSDGTCEYCLSGLTTSCVDGGVFGEPGHDGAQGEAVRVPHADGTLVVVPPALRGADPGLLLPLCDVLPTGQHAARSAGVRYGHRVVVVGDGAVGLCAVIAARRLGAESVVVIGHHEERLDLAHRLGATDVVLGRGDAAVEKAVTLTGGAHAVLECVGAQASLDTAVAVARDGATIGYVGVPHQVEGLDLGTLFGRNIGIAGGIAPARAYIPELITDLALGNLDASAVLDATVDLEGVPDGYVAMDTRKALKVRVDVSPV